MDNVSQDHQSGGNRLQPERKIDSRKTQRRTVPALLVVLLATLLSVKLMGLPLNRILELRYCWEYYQTHEPSRIPPSGDIPESECKIESVQQKLGLMMGALDTTVQACDLAVATPMGYVADKIGRRTVLALNCTSTVVLLLWIIFVGRIKSIPPAAILAGPFFSLFGGGNNVFKSVSVALMSDLAETDTQRTSNISYFLSTDYITMLIGPMLAAILMPHGLWLPLWTGVILIAVALPSLGLVPGQNANRARKSTTKRRDSNVEDHQQEPLLRNHTPSSMAPESPPRKAFAPIHDFVNEYYTLIKTSHKFRLLLVAKFLASFASSSSNLLALYITMRTGWTFAEVGYIYTFKGIINILLAVVVVPALTRRSTSSDPSQTDSTFTFNLAASKLTLLISIIGAIFVALASSRPAIVAALCTYALGSVLPIFMYAIARSSELGVLNQENEGSGFTVLVVVQAVGTLLGAPTMAAVWVQAIELGGFGLGLPYFVSAGAYAVGLGVILFVRS